MSTRAELTYAEVGATRSRETLPTDRHHFGFVRPLGGPEVFDAAAGFVLRFGMQRAAGIAVESASEVAVAGAEVMLRLGRGPVRLAAPVRIVYVLDEPDERGFAYGTLPGHPEAGEELFVVRREGDRVVAEVRAFSRAGRWYTRLGGPLLHPVQHRTPLATCAPSPRRPPAPAPGTPGVIAL